MGGNGVRIVHATCAARRNRAGRGANAMKTVLDRNDGGLARGPRSPTDVSAQTASSYPEKTVRIIVSFPAGGATDILARLVAEHLSGAFGRAVVVENVSGAAGATGTAVAAKADGQRPHAADRPRHRRHVAAASAQRSALRSAARPCGGDADRELSQSSGGASRHSGDGREVADRAGARIAGQPVPELRLRRVAAPLGRMVQAADQNRHPARSLYR